MSALDDIQAAARVFIDHALRLNLGLQELLRGHNAHELPYVEAKVVSLSIGPRTGKTTYMLDRLRNDHRSIGVIADDSRRRNLLRELGPEIAARNPLLSPKLLTQRYYAPGSLPHSLIIVDQAEEAFGSPLMRQQFLQTMGKHTDQFLFLG